MLASSFAVALGGAAGTFARYWLAELFAASGYVATQHLISNVRVDILPGGHRAKITSYLIATHIYDPLSSVQVAHLPNRVRRVITRGLIASRDSSNSPSSMSSGQRGTNV